MLRLWLKRTFRIAPWIVWLAFGWALYLVIPRTVDPPVCTIDLQGFDRFLGFMDSGRVVFVDEHAPVVRTYDAGTGALVQSFPIGGDWINHRAAAFSPVHSLLVVPTLRNGLKSRQWFTVLDLRSRREIHLECGDALNDVRFRFHPQKPWGVFATSVLKDVSTDPNVRRRILAFDLTDGTPLGSIPPAATPVDDRSTYGEPHLVPGTDLVAVNRGVLGEHGEQVSQTLELWRLPFGGSPERSFPGIGIDADVDFSMNERAVWHDRWADPPTLDVVDLRTGRLLLSDPPLADRKGRRFASMVSSGNLPRPRISPDGATVFDEVGVRILDVRTGRTVWKTEWKGAQQPFVTADRNLVEFRVHPALFLPTRLWNDWIASRFPALEYARPVYRFHDARSGALRFCSEETLEGISPDGLLQLPHGVGPQIVRCPHRVRWGVIAIAEGVFGLIIFIVMGLRAHIARKRP